MKKKFLVCVLAGIFVVMFLCAGPNAAKAEPEKITIGFVSIWPMTHFTHVDQIPRYFKMVEEATDGKYTIDIQWYPVGTLLGGGEIYDGVVKGIADAGISSFGYAPGRFPVIMALNQAGVAPPENCNAASDTIWEHYKYWDPEELKDAKVLYLAGTGPGWLHTNKPIRTVDEMKGLRIRCTGGGVLGVKAVGGDPISMPMGDVYVAAKKGMIDALISPLETLEGWKHHEIFKYSTFVPHFYSEFFHITMNWDKWNSLPKDLQDAFDAVAKDAVEDAGQIWEYNQKHAMDFAKETPGGHEFIYFSKTEVNKLKRMLAPVRDQYMDKLNKLGLPGRRIVDGATRIVEKYNKRNYRAWKPEK
jgi:TRAP-type C4-dicarboxylate transport system substrate-binding protein